MNPTSPQNPNPNPNPTPTPPAQSGPISNPPSTPTPPHHMTMPSPTPKKNFFQQWQSWGMIGLAAVAIIGIIVGIVGLASQLSAEDRVKDLEQQLNEANDLLVKYGTELGIKVNEFGRPIHGTPSEDDADSEDDKTNTDKPDNNSTDTKPTTSTTIASSDYIYIGEWGIKIKIPDGLKNVSYTFVNELREDPGGAYNVEVIYLSAILDDMESTPEALRVQYNGGLGALGRSLDDPTKTSSGATLVGKIGDYYYSYSHPQAIFSTDEVEQQQELKVVELIQSMLTTKANITKF